jgi:hypothetical protein
MGINHEEPGGQSAWKTTEYVYEIVIEGELSAHWQNWFEGLSLQACPGGRTLLTGTIPDQSALQGIINRVFDLNLPLIAIRRIET